MFLDNVLDLDPQQVQLVEIGLAAALLGVVLFVTSTLLKAPVALQKDKVLSLRLSKKEIISHDTRLFRFDLPSKEHVLGLPVGQHLYLQAEIGGKNVSRAYTPVTSDDDLGYFDLVVKVYFKNVHPKFPDGGKMTQYVDNMEIGDRINVKGPSGKIHYKAASTFVVQKGLFAVDYKRPAEEIIKAKKIGMIAGGSGITPMLQVVKQALKDENDTSEFWLLFANQTEKDILLRKELDELSKKHSNRFHVWYTIDKSEEDGWKFSTGFINTEMCKEHLPTPDDSVILICGPPPMIKFACVPALTELKFDKSRILTF